MSYDKQQIDQYVEAGGGYCPECECDEARVVGAQRVTKPEDGRIVIRMACFNCNAQWEDSYILDNIECTQPGKHADQQQLFGHAS